MNTQEFQDELRNIIQTQYIPERTKSNNLLIWTLENCFALDRDNAIMHICDGEKDKGIDGIYVDQAEEVIYVFQSKFKEHNDRHIGDRVLRDFSGVKQWFENAGSINKLKESTINNDLRSLLDDLELVDIINEYNVEFHFIINAFPNHDTNEYLAVNQDIKTWDIEKLNKFYYLTSDDPLVIDKHTFNEIPEDSIILNELPSGIVTAITPIKARDLLGLKGINDLSLFNKNVRYGLGNTRVNKSIKKTLNDTSEKGNFLLFHNGISLVCETFNYSNTNNKIVIENYSVVNGTQSILSFYNNETLLDDNITILLRITAVGNNPDLTNLISKYNNNQNAISMRDLRSNDKIQNRLIREFQEIDEELNLNLIYTSKRGTEIPSDYTELTSDYCGQLIEACNLFRPHYTHLKVGMFDARYSEIFNKNTTAVKLVLYHLAHSKLKQLITNINDRGIADYGLAQFFILMCLFKLLSSEETVKEFMKNANHVKSHLNELEEIFNKLLLMVIKAFNNEISKYQRDESFVYKNFFRLRDKVNDASSNIISLFEMFLVYEDSNLKNIFTETGIDL